MPNVLCHGKITATAFFSLFFSNLGLFHDACMLCPVESSVFFRTKSSSHYTYLQLVEGFRQGKKVRQRVIATLGRLDQLQASGALDRLLQSGARLSEHSAVLSALPPPDDPGADSRTLGPALVFERLWQLTSCRHVVSQALRKRRFRFDVERAVFLTVLHRLTAPGSDRSALAWMADQAVAGSDLQLQHLYRAMAWLGQPLPDKDQKHCTHAPRCVKDELEEALFDRRRDLFSDLDLVFFDTTSHYFHGAGGQTLGRRGNSKDYRPQCRQMVLGLVLDNQGLPVCCEMWPGNTADVTTLVPVAQRLQRRFGMRSVCLVADRGMISQATMAAIEERGWSYILGVRMRGSKEFREQVLGADAPELAVSVERAHEPRQQLELKVQDVRVREEGEESSSERRYVVCRNAEQARRDRAVRSEIVAKLRQQLVRSEKQLVGNRGYRRYLRKAVQEPEAVAGSQPEALPEVSRETAEEAPEETPQAGAAWEVDEARIAVEEQFDGVWALRTNAALTATDVALRYKQLWQVEQGFRSAKSLLRTRPVYHRTDETIRGHVFCSFLALVLKKELERRLEAAGIEVEWGDLMRDLGRLRETEVELQGKRFVVRSKAYGVVGKVAQCVGARLPATVRRVGQESAEPAREPAQQLA